MSGNLKELNAKPYMLYPHKGFTLLEALLVVALISISAGVGVVAFSSLYRQSDLEAAQSTLVDALRLAQSKASSIENGREWGVNISPGLVTVFEGDDFTGRDPNFDETMSIAGALSLSGLSEVIFSRPLGTTTDTGAITFSVDGLPERTITLNSFGVMEY